MFTTCRVLTLEIKVFVDDRTTPTQQGIDRRRTPCRKFLRTLKTFEQRGLDFSLRCRNRAFDILRCGCSQQGMQSTRDAGGERRSDKSRQIMLEPKARLSRF